MIGAQAQRRRLLKEVVLSRTRFSSVHIFVQVPSPTGIPGWNPWADLL
jgi:hypothetical protein